MDKKRIYRAWANIMARCRNPQNPSYHNYGGRGVDVCSEWANSYQCFYEWAINNGYADNLTIDRIDVNGNYCPENCRWVTDSEQRTNKRDSILICINGVTKPLSVWARENGLTYGVVYNRYKNGITGAALISPHSQRRKYMSWKKGVAQAMKLEAEAKKEDICKLLPQYTGQS